MNASNSFLVKLTAVLVVLPFLTVISNAADTITINGSLSGDQTLVSETGRFELGFFTPGNTSNYYIAIWYKKIPGNAVIWVANREKPVSDKYASSLTISNDGNLVVVSNVSSSKSPIWSTNLSSKLSSSVEAVLLDNGNLVLRGRSNSAPPLWQSFDYPTDTLMPGGKVGLNKKTKWSRVLRSWKNLKDPATGYYSIERDPNASQFIMLWNQTQIYWTSGLWIPDQRIFALIPELRFLKTQFYNFSYVDNDNESYITYDITNPSFVTRLVMDPSGQLKQLTWLESTQQWALFWSQPGQPCDVLAYCGVYGSCNQNSLPYCHCLQGFEPNSMNQWNLNDYSRGCARHSKLECENHSDASSSSTDKFLASPNMVFPRNPISVLASSSKECETACLGNCSCSAYAFDNDKCSIWYGELLNMKQLSDNGGQTLHLRLAASELQSSSHMKLVIGILVGLLMGLVILLCLRYVVQWRNKRRLVRAAKAMENSFTRFGYRDLQSATKNFSERLGRGGFGSVFKGTLPDSTVIAVKKLESIGQSQGEKQFRTEVAAIGTIQHVNLVRLRGFCSEGTQRLLVYDYMSNGSLNTHLFQKEGAGTLSWTVRYQIVIGVARGLVYLHEKCRDCIIHCDIKPENILLDAEFCPKVADFGLAKLVGRDFSRVLTTMRGTRGYLAPEWISGLAITAKADVYSYGMMLFELVSGRRNTQTTSDGRVDFFPTWATTKLIRGEDVLNILDPSLERQADTHELMRVCKVACWCIQEDEIQRPTMGQVVQVLEGLLDIDMPSLPRSLKMFVDGEPSTLFLSELLLSDGSTETTTHPSATYSSTHGTSSKTSSNYQSLA